MGGKSDNDREYLKSEFSLAIVIRLARAGKNGQQNGGSGYSLYLEISIPVTVTITLYFKTMKRYTFSPELSVDRQIALLRFPQRGLSFFPLLISRPPMQRTPISEMISTC